MRVLLLLRGSAGCGKSTWTEQNGLKPYTLSKNICTLRKMFYQTDIGRQFAEEDT
jgi:predicted kinase